MILHQWQRYVANSHLHTELYTLKGIREEACLGILPSTCCSAELYRVNARPVLNILLERPKKAQESL